MKKNEIDVYVPGRQDSHTSLNERSQLQKHIFKVGPFGRKQNKATHPIGKVYMSIPIIYPHEKQDNLLCEVQRRPNIQRVLERYITLNAVNGYFLGDVEGNKVEVGSLRSYLSG